MKVGLISDIHGDYTSLMTCLKIFKKVGVHKVLCAGDLVEKGKEGDAVVALIDKLKIPCVLGNHDEMAPGNQQWVKDNMDLSHPHTRTLLLKPESLDYLEQLPRNLRFEWDGLRILLVHGSPASNVEYLMRQTSYKTFAEHAQASRADIIICGHTHRHIHYLIDDVHFVNPGAVYQYVSSHTCAVLSLPDIKLTVFHLRDKTVEVMTPQTPPNKS